MCKCVRVCVFVIYCLMSFLLIAHKLQLEQQELERSGSVERRVLGTTYGN